MSLAPVTRSCQPRLDLLKPDLKGVSEERKRAASLARLVFAGLALILWTMVGLKVWEISIVAEERRPDEVEKVRVDKEIAELQEILSTVPERVRLAREDLYTQVQWSERTAAIRGLVAPSSAFGQFKAQKDGAMTLSGIVWNPAVFAPVLDSISEVDFVTGIKTSSLTYKEQGYYEFQVTFGTVPNNGKK